MALFGVQARLRRKPILFPACIAEEELVCVENKEHIPPQSVRSNDCGAAAPNSVAHWAYERVSPGLFSPGDASFFFSLSKQRRCPSQQFFELVRER